MWKIPALRSERLYFGTPTVFGRLDKVAEDSFTLISSPSSRRPPASSSEVLRLASPAAAPPAVLVKTRKGRLAGGDEDALPGRQRGLAFQAQGERPDSVALRINEGIGA